MESSEEPRNFLKYCPHCGSSSFAPKSDKELVCGSCGFRFFTNSAAAVAAIIVDGEGRVMLTRRAVEPWKGMLDLPGGFVDPGESLEEALRRELREELDFMPEKPVYLCSFANRYVFSGYAVRTTDAAFVCHTERTRFAPSDDIDLVEWHPASALPLHRVAAPSIRRILETYSKLAPQS